MRPEAAFADKCLSKFRDYSVNDEDPLKERVRRTYRDMHLNQTVDFVKGKRTVKTRFKQKNIFQKKFDKCFQKKLFQIEFRKILKISLKS